MRQEERQRRIAALKKENEDPLPFMRTIYERKAEVQVEIEKEEAVIEYVNNVSEVEANLSKDDIAEEIFNQDFVVKSEELVKDSLEVENLTTNEKSKKKKNLPKE